MIDDVKEAIQRGQKGEVRQIMLTDSTGQRSKLGSVMSLTKGRYIIAGGSPGSGKSSILDSEFLLRPFTNYLENGGTKPFWIYRSMERVELEKKAKWICWKIYDLFKELLDVPTLLGYSNKLRDLTPKDLEMVDATEPFFNELFKHLDLKAGANSPAAILDYGLKYAYQKGLYCETDRDMIKINGEVQGRFEDYEMKNGAKHYYVDIHHKLGPFRYYKGDVTYFEFDKDCITLHITDHLQKLTEQGKSEQALINEHGANVANVFRDVLEWTVIDIMQFNREQYDTLRQVKTSLKVTEKDFRMSSIPFQNADHVLGFLDPHQHTKSSHRGYNIGKQPGNGFITERGYSRFRGMDIVKNSFGGANISLGYKFLGECGYVEELPKADEMDLLTYENIRNE